MTHEPIEHHNTSLGLRRDVFGMNSWNPRLYMELSCEIFKIDVLRTIRRRVSELFHNMPMPQIGDIIRFPRVGYSHFAIYIGDGRVIHFSGPREDLHASSHDVDIAVPQDPTGQNVDTPDVYSDYEAAVLKNLEALALAKEKLDEEAQEQAFGADVGSTSKQNKKISYGQSVDIPDVSYDLENYPPDPPPTTPEAPKGTPHLTSPVESQSQAVTVGKSILEFKDTAASKALAMFRANLPTGLTEQADKCDLAEVRIDKLISVVDDSKPEVCNYLDDKYPPFPPEEVVARAKTKLGEKGYDLLRNNCEHFVTWCRYDVGHCEQVDRYERVWIAKKGKVASYAFDVHYFVKHRFRRERRRSLAGDEASPDMSFEVYKQAAVKEKTLAQE